MIHHSSAREVARRHVSHLVIHSQSEALWFDEALRDAVDEAEREGWPDIRAALMHAEVVRSGYLRSPNTHDLIDRFEIEAATLGLSALRAVALIDRVTFMSDHGLSGTSFDSLASALVLLRDTAQPAWDRVSGLINLGLLLRDQRMWELSHDVFSEALDVADELDDAAQPHAVITFNQAELFFLQALIAVEAGQADAARGALLLGSEIIGSLTLDRLPAGWTTDLSALGILARVLVEDGELADDERQIVAAVEVSGIRLTSVLIHLMMPMETWSCEPDLDRMRNTQLETVAYFLHARALERSGADSALVVAAHRRHAQAVAALSWKERLNASAGLAAQIESFQLSSEHRVLSTQVLTDSLTGLGNRRAFEQFVAAHLGTDVAVLFVDLDDFKATNDAYGHQIGDDVLARIGTVLAEASDFGPHVLNDLDVAPVVLARIGGDEFAIVRTDLDERAAFSLATQIEDRLDAIDWSDLLGARRQHGTIGVAHGPCGDVLVGEADADLYRRKGVRSAPDIDSRLGARVAH